MGKSTLARRFADEHPGTLALDLDVLVGLIGGWKQNFSGALDLARSYGRHLATRHLRAGNDVIVPQLVTVHDRDPDPAFEATARAVDAAYIQVALTVEDREHRRRLRSKRPLTEVEASVQAMLEDHETDLVSAIRGHLNEYLDGRPQTLRLDTTELDEDESYQCLLDLLAAA